MHHAFIFYANKQRGDIILDAFIFRDSDPREVYYGGIVRGESAMRYESQIGPSVVHTYEVTI